MLDTPGHADLQQALDAALRENAQLQRQLAAATGELESFTYSVSHDLRASLRHISAFVEIINEDRGAGIDADLDSHLATITHAAGHMALMIDGLMALSLLGRVELNLSPVNVRELIDEVCEALQADPSSDHADSLPAQRHSVQWCIASDFPPLRADPVLLRQLLLHLISNAIKFTRPAAGRPAAEIEIGWRWMPVDSDSTAPREEALYELFVKDNGIGFNPKFGSKLFGVFQRLHSASEFEGIGMGLALSRKIVERHGGSMAASSQVPVSPDLCGGCEVTFSMPSAASRA